MCPLGPCGAGSPPVPRAGFGTAGPRLGTVSHRRTLPSISQPPPRGTIHLHSIFTPLHMFPFQPRIIFYHQITAAIRWSRCDSEQSSRPPLSPPALLASPQFPPSLLAAHRQGVIQMSGGSETPGGRICWLRTNLSRQRVPGCAAAPPGSLQGAPLLRHHRPAPGAPRAGDTGGRGHRDTGRGPWCRGGRDERGCAVRARAAPRGPAEPA